jgi:hypothetical protein
LGRAGTARPAADLVALAALSMSHLVERLA